MVSGTLVRTTINAIMREFPLKTGLSIRVEKYMTATGVSQASESEGSH